MPASPSPTITDCHVHVVEDYARYPMLLPRPYTPPLATRQQLHAMLNRIGASRVVIIQLSLYGTDNRCMLDAMADIASDPTHQHQVRGVIHTTPDTSLSDLDAYHQQGVRGIRINLLSYGISDVAVARTRLKQTARQCAGNGWHVQIFTTADIIASLADDIKSCPVPVVLDHFAMLSTRQRGSADELAIRRLLADGHVWIKLSGTYRLDDANARDLQADLYADNPDQLVWGSDWPHPPEHKELPKAHPPTLAYEAVDSGVLLANCRTWLGDGKAETRVLESNPQTLYDF